MKNFIVDDITQLIGETPLIRLKKVINPLSDAEVLAKLESFNPGGSLKDRACLSMIEEAEKEGHLREGATVIEPTSGNTGIGLAMICAVRGYRCILVMPESLSLERLYMLRVYGADVVLTPTHLGISGSIKKAEELARRIPNSFIPRQFDNPANPQAHRATTAKEILDVCGKRIDAFVAGVGTGGTITGVGEILKKEIPSVRIVAVEPENCPVLSKGKAGLHRIQGIGAGFVPKALNRSVINEVITVSDKEAYVMMRRLGKEEGISVGISSGAAMVAAARLAKRYGKGKRIVVIFCDTGERYFSLEQYFEA